jgi:hypothetical protein
MALKLKSGGWVGIGLRLNIQYKWQSGKECLDVTLLLFSPSVSRSIRLPWSVLRGVLILVPPLLRNDHAICHGVLTRIAGALQNDLTRNDTIAVL